MASGLGRLCTNGLAVGISGRPTTEPTRVSRPKAVPVDGHWAELKEVLEDAARQVEATRATPDESVSSRQQAARVRDGASGPTW